METSLVADQTLAGGLLTGGQAWHVKPYSGSDSANSGKSPTSAFKTLAVALAAASYGDTVYLHAESNTAALTTDYQAATLVWNKDGVNLVGLNSGSLFSQRSRVAFASTYVGASNLFTLSANDCLIQGIEFWAGVNSANPTGCMNVTGSRNVIRNCQISGMGTATPYMDSAGAYSLQIAGGSENLFDEDVIGQNTVTLGAAVNAVVYLTAAAARNIFKKCRFKLFTNHATNCVFLRVAAGGIDRSNDFEDCRFVNAVDSGSTVLTSAFVVASTVGGGIDLIGSTSVKGATDWNSTDSGNVWALGGSVTGGTFGLGALVTR
jgi:hypothetical protein